MINQIKSVNFHGYNILESGVILGKNGSPLVLELRKRNGGGVDQTVRMYIGKKMRKFTVQRLVACAFQGPVFGYEINHKDRNTLNNHNDNLERVTPSENQMHWREFERKNL